MEDIKWYMLIYYGTIFTEKKLRVYRKLLNSDQYFTREEYEYFGKRIYELRIFRKKCSSELARRFN